MSISTVSPAGLVSSVVNPTELEHYRMRSQYLEVVLAAVLRHCLPSGSAVVLDLQEAACGTDVLVEALDYRRALVAWGDVNEDVS